VPDLDYDTLPAPLFAVLDRVRISLDGDTELSVAIGTVHQVRYYPSRGYRYAVSHDELGGVLDEAMLAATGERDTVDSFWYPPLRKGDVVLISTGYPKPKWHGYIATVEDCGDENGNDSYGLAIAVGPDPKRGGMRMKYRTLETRYLIPTGERIPPQPVPRPVTTWRANGAKGLHPTHEFSIIDDIDHYL
jgi:hypothetical protein